MEKKLVLNAQNREKGENTKHLRKEKLIPCVVYGKKQEPISLKVNYFEFLKLFRIAGESKIIDLDIEGKKIEVLVYEVVKEPVKGEFEHIDFYAITKGEKVTTNIPLVFIGSAKASIDGAIIEEHIKEIEVRVLPKDLVDSIEVDISKLENIGDDIRVSDLVVDREKFEILDNPDEIVIVASRAKEEKVEEEVVETPEGTETGEGGEEKQEGGTEKKEE